MGRKFEGKNEKFNISAETFEPKIVFLQDKQRIPEKFYFQELILQSLIRRKFKYSILEDVLKFFNVNHSVNDFEILGEKALPEGFVDIFIKLKHPKGENKFLLVEIKTRKASKKIFSSLMDILMNWETKQLEEY